MSAETVSTLNFMVHSLVIGAAAWLLVRFVIRDAMRRCILANLAVLMCLYGPFNISMEDLFPPQRDVPVWTPIRETFKADWRVSVAPASTPIMNVAAKTRAWDVNEKVRVLRWLFWLVTAALWLRLLYQSIRVQRWAWRLRQPTEVEHERLPDDLNSERVCVFDHEGTPCVAGWFFPVIAVPASAFEKLTARQWSWLLRHEAEHLRCNDTAAVLLQNIVRAFLWWNPFAHALIEEYARAREEACDAAAVGGERDHTAYADFLLAWAGRSERQHECVMAIAYSRPAKRLKVRLVALMEARGVRKKLGALFVLGCLAFAVVAPLIAASFGIATASAQAVVEAKADDGTLYTREYKVAPDFLSAVMFPSDPFAPGKAPTRAVKGKTARELLKDKGVSFPPGASASYNPGTSLLIVRNTKSNLEMVERGIDALNERPMMVYFTSKLIQADRFFGTHESILSPADAQTLIRSVSQKKGIDLLSSPSATTRFDQNAGIFAGREVLPKLLPNGKLSGERKFVGVSIELIAKSPAQGKSIIETNASLGVDPDSDAPWFPKGINSADWDKVSIHSVAAKAALASGETLMLHLPTSKRPVTVLITAAALNPSGGNAESFSATMRVAPPASQGRDLPEEKAMDKEGTELVVRVYKLPAGFGDGKKPVEYLEEKGVVFPQGANAQLGDGMLTVRNTQGNHDLIEKLLMMHLTAGGQKGEAIRLDVRMAEVSAEAGKKLGDWDPWKMKWRRDDDSSWVPISQAPPEIRHVFAASGILTNVQLQTLLAAIDNAEGVTLVSLPNATTKNDQRVVFEVPTQLGGKQLGVRPKIESSSGSLRLNLQLPDLIPAQKNLMVTEVTIWDGQTMVLSGIPAEKVGVTRMIFITAKLIESQGEPAKK